MDCLVVTLGEMATERVRRRCYEQIAALTAEHVDAIALRLRIIELLRPVVGFERWCWPICDPASGLGTSGIGEHDYWPALQRLLLLEQQLTEPNALPRLAGPSTLGARAQGLRFVDVLGPFGIGDELRVPLADKHGLWGCLDLLRSSDQQPFSDEDVAFLELLAPLLAAATRRSAAAAAGPQASLPPPAGVIVLDADLNMHASTAGARAWLAELAPPTFEFAETAALAVVYNVAARALSPLAEALPARVRVRAISGAWAIVEAEILDPFESTVAVTIRPAAPEDVLDLRLLAHDLTAREREIVLAVIDGSDTRAVSQRLFLSPHTVNDHLKAIFRKVGVRTRKELMASLAGPSAREGR